MDRCCDIVRPLLDADLKELLYPAGNDAAAGCAERMKQTDVTQPILFIFSYALAQLLMKWGLKPSALIGHSAGEYVAACLAGVMTLEEALELVALRGRLMHGMPPGAMLSVPLPEQELKPLLADGVSIAAVNGAALCVASGPHDEIDRLERQLAEAGHACSRLHTSHAFHSAMMEPIMEPFRRKVREMTLRAPAIPYISNVSGTWITAEEAVEPEYWVRHLRGTVRFADGLRELLRDGKAVFVEAGPGNALSAFVRRHPDKPPRHAAVNLVRHPKEQARDDEYLLQQVGRLWLEGARPDWRAFHAGERRKRTALPTYPFERRRYWVDPPFEIDVLKQGLTRKRNPDSRPQDSAGFAKRNTVREWLYAPVWERSFLQEETGSERSGSLWVVFSPEDGIIPRLIDRMREAGRNVVAVHPSDSFSPLNDWAYRIDPGEPEHYERLLRTLTEAGRPPGRIIHAWLAAEAGEADAPIPSDEDRALDRGYYSLLALARAIGSCGIQEELHLAVVTSHMQEVTGDERLQPEQAAAIGACLVIPQEYGHVCCRSIDIADSLRQSEPERQQALVERLHAEIAAPSDDLFVAYRGAHRWVQKYARLPAPAADTGLRKHGVYLITGGLGGIGLTLAEHLAKTVQAKLILVGRSGLDGEGAAKRGALDELERYGSEVLVCKSDVCDEARMEQVAAEAVARFGAIHGVIHAAGVSDGALIQRRTREMDERALAAKVNGTRVLDRVLERVLGLAGMRLDFLVLCSSLTAALGGVGQAGYCAANAYLDAYACRKRAQGGTPVVAIAWDGWQTVGMAAAAEQEIAAITAQAGVRAQGPDKLTRLMPEEGVEVFRQALACRRPQVLVSTTDLPLRVHTARASSLHSLMDKQRDGTGPQAARPEVGTAYAPPEDELEQTMADLWRNYLGLDQVGLHDNFFELGATSLDIIQMNTKLQRALGREVAVVDMFSHPTIYSLAESLRRAAHKETVPPEETADRSERIHDGKNRLKQRLQKRERT